jgi:tyrosinase
LDKLFKEYNVQENVDILHKIVQDSKDRKSKGEARNDAWRENINPRTSICAKTIPVVEKGIARLQRQLKEVSA